MNRHAYGEIRVDIRFRVRRAKNLHMVRFSGLFSKYLIAYAIQTVLPVPALSIAH
jgi:hypothetical protein